MDIQKSFAMMDCDVKGVAILKAKSAEGCGRMYLPVWDDILPGLISGKFYLLTTNARLEPLDILADGYLFPKKKDGWIPEIIAFLKGHSPELFKKIEYYEA